MPLHELKCPVSALFLHSSFRLSELSTSIQQRVKIFFEDYFIEPWENWEKIRMIFESFGMAKLGFAGGTSKHEEQPDGGRMQWLIPIASRGVLVQIYNMCIDNKLLKNDDDLLITFCTYPDDKERANLEIWKGLGLQYEQIKELELNLYLLAYEVALMYRWDDYLDRSPQQLHFHMSKKTNVNISVTKREYDKYKESKEYVESEGSSSGSGSSVGATSESSGSGSGSGEGEDVASRYPILRKIAWSFIDRKLDNVVSAVVGRKNGNFSEDVNWRIKLRNIGECSNIGPFLIKNITKKIYLNTFTKEIEKEKDKYLSGSGSGEGYTSPIETTVPAFQLRDNRKIFLDIEDLFYIKNMRCGGADIPPWEYDSDTGEINLNFVDVSSAFGIRSGDEINKENEENEEEIVEPYIELQIEYMSG